MAQTNIITFIIPVRHPDNTQNWNRLKKNLSETIRSISHQDMDGWKAIIVANRGSELPTLPEGFDIKWVDLPSNSLYRGSDNNKDKFYEAVRIDKGRRVLAGLLHAGEMGHVMIVDDDDFVSRRLTSFVSTNRNANGWYIRDGYLWGDGGLLLYNYSDFSRLCGTSHIIRSDLYKIPHDFESADDQYITRYLGSHVFLHDILIVDQTPLEALPFKGAVYRIGHNEAHSRSRGILRQFFLRKSSLANPKEIFTHLKNLRIKGTRMNKEYFGFK